MSDSIDSCGCTIGPFLLTLFLVLFVLKLGQVIDWSWWWITPFWCLVVAGVVFAVGLSLIMFGFVVAIFFADN